MKKLFLLPIAIIVLSLTSCEVEVPGETIFQEIEVPVYTDQFGAMSTIQNTTQLGPNQEFVLLTITIDGFNLLKLDDFEISLRTTLNEFIDAFDYIKLIEKNNKVNFNDEGILDLEDDRSELYLDYSNVYHLDGTKHEFEVIAKRNSYSGTGQILIDDIDIELERYGINGDLEINIEYDPIQNYVFFLE